MELGATTEARLSLLLGRKVVIVTDAGGAPSIGRLTHVSSRRAFLVDEHDQRLEAFSLRQIASIEAA